MKMTFIKDEITEYRLNKLKDEYGLSYTEAIKRGLFLLEKELASGANEIGKAYQESLVKFRGRK